MSRRRLRTEERECGYCRNGVMGMGTCPICDGSKRVLFRLKPDKELRPCQPCNGNGHYGPGRHDECDGTGWVVVRARHG